MPELSGQTRVAGVWGYPVTHSRSPKMQNAALSALGLDWVYVPFSVAPERVAEAVAAVRALDLVGVNVTVPLKELVAPWLDAVDPDAEAIGSINTIVNEDGHLRGYSTDGPGLWEDLAVQGAAPDPDASVFIWGAGGSALAVAALFARRGFRVTVSNRTAERARALAARIGGLVQAAEWDGPDYQRSLSEASLLINCTSLGLAPHAAGQMPPVPAGALHAGQTVYDLVYAPPVTPLLHAAQGAGCRTLNGLGMLVMQGALSLSLWTKLPLDQLPLNVMRTAVAAPDGHYLPLS